MRFLQIITLCLSCFFINLHAQTKEIQWMSMEEALEKHAKQPRPIILDAYTDWCGWCKKLDATTFRDPNIVDYVNRNFYAVKFEADTKDTINYKGKQYINSQPLTPKVPNRRAPMHTLGYELGISSFPTIVYFDKNLNPNPAPGYQSAKDIQPILVYFAEEVTVPYRDYLEMYKRTFYPQEVDYKPVAQANTYSIEEALELQKKEPRKILIDLRASYMLTSRMMPTTLEDSVIANYINENYYLVEFDVFSKDTINAFGGKFYVDSLSTPFNGLAVAFLEGKMNNMPTLIYLDEDQKMINKTHNYMSPKELEPIIKYIGEDHYKNEKWPEFIKHFQGEL